MRLIPVTLTEKTTARFKTAFMHKKGQEIWPFRDMKSRKVERLVLSKL